MSITPPPRARRRLSALALGALAAIGTLGGCARVWRDADVLPAPIPRVKGEPRTQYSMRYLDVAVGTGLPAEAGKQFVVHYTGWLRDGTKFDSSRDRDTPFSFVQGRRAVIAGWDTGFEGMRVGGRRRLFIPYQLAYGEKGRNSIPPKAALIFDVELLDVKEAPPAPTTPPR